jgi:hypothetical protein
VALVLALTAAVAGYLWADVRMITAAVALGFVAAMRAADRPRGSR